MYNVVKIKNNNLEKFLIVSVGENLKILSFEVLCIMLFKLWIII